MLTHRIAVVGAGYVGLTTGACLAFLGHSVVCSDVDAAKIERLSRGEAPMWEPGLPELIGEGVNSGRLEFVVGSASATSTAEFVFLCVPTPMGSNGAADLTAVDSVVREVAGVVPTGCVLVCKSTVPVGTASRLSELLEREDVAVVSNPEFLREGSAVQDFLHPDRIVVGAESAAVGERVATLYSRLAAPTVRTDLASAEMVKHVSNSFLATKLSYINAVARVCERVDANIFDVVEGVGSDSRIGSAFLRAGPGWGGSCLEKDTAALMRVADSVGIDFRLLREAIDSNVDQHEEMVTKVLAACGRDGSLHGVRLGLLGLTFKAGTADLRGSQALAIARALAERGAELVGHDPALRGDEDEVAGIVAVVDDPYQAAKSAAGMVVLTEWEYFRSLDWGRIAGLLDKPVVVDTRNHLDPAFLHRVGMRWTGVGMPPGHKGRAG